MTNGTLLCEVVHNVVLSDSSPVENSMIVFLLYFRRVNNMLGLRFVLRCHSKVPT